jgi:hypothetical protein
MDDFNESLQKVGQHIYGGAQAGSASGSQDQASGDGQTSEGEVVDAEYKEV